MKSTSQKLFARQDEIGDLSIIIGNRIPKDFFITTGVGQSDVTIHAGSYDMAVKEAGIQNYNIISYTSILPKGAQLVEKPKEFVHGSVMEAITAVSNATKGKIATAGLIFGWIYDKRTNENLGGLVAEYNEHGDEREARKVLQASMDEMFWERYRGDDNYEMRDMQIITRSIVPKKKFGTALVAICFTNYRYPVIGYEYSGDGKIIVQKKTSS